MRSFTGISKSFRGERDREVPNSVNTGMRLRDGHLSKERVLTVHLTSKRGQYTLGFTSLLVPLPFAGAQKLVSKSNG